MLHIFIPLVCFIHFRGGMQGSFLRGLRPVCDGITTRGLRNNDLWGTKSYFVNILSFSLLQGVSISWCRLHDFLHIYSFSPTSIFRLPASFFRTMGRRRNAHGHTALAVYLLFVMIEKEIIVGILLYMQLAHFVIECLPESLHIGTLTS